MTDDKIENLVDQIIQNSSLGNTDEKSEHEKTKIDIDKVDFDNIDDKTKKAYRDITNGLLDYYKILGVSSKDPTEVIREKGREKLKNLHPDKRELILSKLPPEQRATEKRKLEIQYKLVHEAFNVLKDPTKRKGYDIQKKAVDGKDFSAKKQSFDEFKKMQEAEMNEKSKDLAKLTFKEESDLMNKKHGYNPDIGKTGPMNKKEVARKFNDFMTERDQQDIEFTPKNIFEHRQFNQEEFNKKWEEQEKKKKKKKNVDGTMILWNDIAAANDTGISGGTEDFVPVDNNYGDLYATSEHNPTNFASVDNNNEDDDNKDADNEDDTNEEKNDNIEVDTNNKYNDKDDVMKRLEQFQKERDADIHKLQDKSVSKSEFGTVQDNPFNISYQMKEIIGEDIAQIESHKRKTFDKDFAEVYKQLVYDK